MLVQNLKYVQITAARQVFIAHFLLTFLFIIYKQFNL